MLGEDPARLPFGMSPAPNLPFVPGVGPVLGPSRSVVRLPGVIRPGSWVMVPWAKATVAVPPEINATIAALLICFHISSSPQQKGIGRAAYLVPGPDMPLDPVLVL